MAASNTLQAFNTLHLQAQAPALCIITSLNQLREALADARALGLPVLPLGQGSNVVLCGDVVAMILKIELYGRTVLSVDEETVTVRVAAGEDWHQLVLWSLAQGYYGLENLALIPGTVGAAPIQNIGAYGRELAPFVTAVHALRCSDGEVLTLSREHCAFGYRDSVFKHALRDTVVITHVDLRLSRQPRLETGYPGLQAELERAGVEQPTPLTVCDAVVALRRAKLPDPALEPNAGSFFKNPVLSRSTAEALHAVYPQMPLYPQGPGKAKLSAAWLIEQTGWKGVRMNGVGIHPGHALVLVNYGGDNGGALLALARDVRAAVANRFDIVLEIEPRVYGEPG